MVISRPSLQDRCLARGEREEKGGKPFFLKRSARRKESAEPSRRRREQSTMRQHWVSRPLREIGTDFAAWGCGLLRGGVEEPRRCGMGLREGAGTQDIRSFRAVEHKMWWFCEDRGVKKPTKSKRFLMGFWLKCIKRKRKIVRKKEGNYGVFPLFLALFLLTGRALLW